MADQYNPVDIETKWQHRWEASGLYHVDDDAPGPKHYALTMYPYPSGDLHIGHWYAVAPSDARARFMRMKGYNVLFPLGFDAFGLPAENAAIRNQVHPCEWTYANMDRMRGQLRRMGTMADWSREIITCEPEYYRWNQWFFLRMMERGLAYRAFAPVDWCPECNTTLAREQVQGTERLCERCETPVIKRELNQWRLRITAYAEELLDFSKMDWPERVVTAQRNWIGRSEGAEFSFQVVGSDEEFRVFTTRPDTLFGVTFCVLAPEHPLVRGATTDQCREDVEGYVREAERKTEIDRLSAEREKTGVFTGAYAEHPLTDRQIPIYIADYVVMGYGAGAIMAVPAHDARDFEFAQKFGLDIPVVIAPPNWDGEPLSAAYTGEGVMVNSGKFDGLSGEAGIQAVAEELERLGIGGSSINYRLRDWLISRQRYWGTPIPVVLCQQCGPVGVPDDQLPVTLPDDVEFLPTGESPLRQHEGFLHTICPKCGGAAERETDTMDTFVDSSWYQFRFIRPHYEDGPFDPEAARQWCPVDQYTGGFEHATMHLLYTRFFNKVIRDLGLTDNDEPMRRLFNQGVITGFTYRVESGPLQGQLVPAAEVEVEGETARRKSDGAKLTITAEKMSKSKGNVADPDDYIDRFGADAVRLFLMFIGPWDQGGPWNPQGVSGVVRFRNRVWNLYVEAPAVEGEPTPAQISDLRRATHQTIKKTGDDLENFAFNTMVAALMEYVNTLYHVRETPVVNHPAWGEALECLALMLAPSAPHLAEEVWELLGRDYSVHQQGWPAYQEELLVEDSVEIVIQINGKVRDRIRVPVGMDREAVGAAALASEKVKAGIDGKTVRKTIVVPGRLVNLVVS